MNTQLIAIFAILGLGVFFMLVAWSALAVSQREEREQQRWIETMAAVGQQEWPHEAPSAKGDYPADEDNNEA